MPRRQQAAAEQGLKKPFEIPKIVHEEEGPLDPSGKAEKDAYRPDPPTKGTPPPPLFP